MLNHKQSSSRTARKLAAYAAGAFAINSAQVHGAIIYRDLGREEISFPFDAFSLDVDLDGTHEFLFHFDTHHHHTCTFSTTFSETSCRTATYVYARVAGAIEGSSARFLSDGLGNVSRFDAGGIIDPVLLGQVEGGTLASYSNSSWGAYRFGGPFHGRRGYLGFSFDLEENVRVAGWVQLEVAVGNNLHALRIFDYAYETTPDVPIAAGETGLLTGGHGDTDRDGDVDLDDLNNVRNNFGGAGLGDTNADGMVDLEDLNAVRNNFGAASGVNPVPGPPSLVLLAAGAAGLGALRRIRGNYRQH